MPERGSGRQNNRDGPYKSDCGRATDNIADPDLSFIACECFGNQRTAASRPCIQLRTRASTAKWGRCSGRDLSIHQQPVFPRQT